MFTIIGADGREYGPVAAEQVKSWIAAGRADYKTKARREGSIQWKPLTEFPEFASGSISGQPPAIAGMAPAGPMDAKIYAADLVARAPKLGIGDTIGRSWELLKGNFWLLVGATFVVLLAQAVLQAVLHAIPILRISASLLLTGVFLGGLYFYYLRRLRGKPWSLATRLPGLRWPSSP